MNPFCEGWVGCGSRERVLDGAYSSGGSGGQGRSWYCGEEAEWGPAGRPARVAPTRKKGEDTGRAEGGIGGGRGLLRGVYQGPGRLSGQYVAAIERDL